MATKSAETPSRAELWAELKKLRKRVKVLEGVDGELWQEIADKDEARALMEDEIRDIAERARRGLARHEKDH